MKNMYYIKKKKVNLRIYVGTEGMGPSINGALMIHFILDKTFKQT